MLIAIFFFFFFFCIFFFFFLFYLFIVFNFFFIVIIIIILILSKSSHNSVFSVLFVVVFVAPYWAVSPLVYLELPDEYIYMYTTRNFTTECKTNQYSHVRWRTVRPRCACNLDRLLLFTGKYLRSQQM